MSSRSLPASASMDEMQRVREIIARACVVTANLALLGDKRLLFSRSGRSFIAYGVRGATWVALGDPTGEAAERAGLIADFLDLCRRHGGRPLFYRADAECLALYAQAGLSALKIGEEAHVRLTDGGADLAGPARRNLRTTSRRAERDGCRFEIVPPAEVAELLPELIEISRSWLHNKSTREKGFSCGYFDVGYLANFPLAIVRCHGVPVAFGNLWLASDRSALMVDLMRRNAAAPYGTMDFLFAHLMRWAADQGYACLNLGMAPLAGFDERQSMVLWRWLARLMMERAGRFYNFAGLRRFKEKFSPEWRPKYVVSRGGAALPFELFDLAVLVAGGLRGLIAK